MSEAEITALVQQLQQNASVFGTNVVIDWDGVIVRVTDPDASSTGRNGTESDFIDMALFRGVVPTMGGDPPAPAANGDVINIYFTGNFIDAYGATLDPRSAFLRADANPQLAEIEPGFIFINDAGFQFGNADPATLSSRLTLEHEMEHYLARFTLRTFGAGASARAYNSGEHVTSGVNLLLAGPNVPPGGRSLTIPGRSRPNGQDELGEISQRVFVGLWNAQ